MRLEGLASKSSPNQPPLDRSLISVDEDAINGPMPGPSKRKRGHGEEAREDRKKVKTEKEEEAEAVEEDDDEMEGDMKKLKVEEQEATTGGEEECNEDVKPRLAHEENNRGQGSSRNIKAEVLKPRCVYFALSLPRPLKRMQISNSTGARPASN